MFRALKLAHRRGKTVVAMKVLGSAFPPLVRNYESSINSIAKLDFVDAIVIGVRSLEEVKRNVRAILSS